VLFRIKLSRVLSGNSPFALNFGYFYYLASLAPFSLKNKGKYLGSGFTSSHSLKVTKLLS